LSLFITFEGSEGSGKTTQLRTLAEFLRQNEYPVLTTREPGGTSIGDQIREVLLDPANTAMHPRTEILLFQASRTQLVEEVIRPHLKRGYVVLSDRYADSTVAYQGYGQQVDLETLQTVIKFATGGLNPDLTLLLDVDVEEGLRRRADDGKLNRLDAFEVAFYQRVRYGYYQMAAADSDRWVIIDANQPLDLVQAMVQKVVLERLEEVELGENSQDSPS
jgi:dTMP kinase